MSWLTLIVFGQMSSAQSNNWYYRQNHEFDSWIKMTLVWKYITKLFLHNIYRNLFHMWTLNHILLIKTLIFIHFYFKNKFIIMKF